MSDVVAARIDSTVRASEKRQTQLVETRLTEASTALERSFAEGTLKSWNERIDKDLATLDERMNGYAKGVHDRMTASDARLTAVERELTKLREWCQRISSQADQLERQLAQARERPVDPNPPTRGPQTDGPPTDGQPADREPDNPEQSALVDKWITGLKDTNPEVVFTATIELGKLGDRRATGPLLKILEKHKELWPRLGAATALGDLRSPDAVPSLIDAIQDKEELVRSAAANALRDITQQDFQYVQGLSRAERKRIQNQYRKWWKEHEPAIRQRLSAK